MSIAIMQCQYFLHRQRIIRINSDFCKILKKKKNLMPLFRYIGYLILLQITCFSEPNNVKCLVQS